MSENNNKARTKNIINLDRKKIEQVAKNNQKNINILEDCEKFCKKYGNNDLKVFNIYNLKNICDEGNGLLNNYFIAENKNKIDSKTILQLEYIIMNANYILHVKQMENTRQSTVELREKLNKTMHRANKLEKDAEYRTKELKKVKNDIKSIMTTIISIILAISIIPTAIAGIEKISGNYVLPFLSSIILFGIIMITFVYSIYQDKLKISTWIILITSIIICILFWYNSFKIDINMNKEYNNITEENKNNQIELKSSSNKMAFSYGKEIRYVMEIKWKNNENTIKL